MHSSMSAAQAGSRHTLSSACWLAPSAAAADAAAASPKALAAAAESNSAFATSVFVAVRALAKRLSWRRNRPAAVCASSAARDLACRVCEDSSCSRHSPKIPRTQSEDSPRLLVLL